MSLIFSVISGFGAVPSVTAIFWSLIVTVQFPPWGPVMLICVTPVKSLAFSGLNRAGISCSMNSRGVFASILLSPFDLFFEVNWLHVIVKVFEMARELSWQLFRLRLCEGFHMKRSLSFGLISSVALASSVFGYR